MNRCPTTVPREVRRIFNPRFRFSAELVAVGRVNVSRHFSGAVASTGLVETERRDTAHGFPRTGPCEELVSAIAKTRQVQKLLPEADNELALETLLPGFGHDLSLHLGNSLFQIFRLKVGCPDQKRYRVQGSYNEDSMCSVQALHGVSGLVNSSSKGYDGICMLSTTVASES